MMFYGHKDETKDVDLFFEKEEDRQEFIHVLKMLDYEETSPMKVYTVEKLREKHRPLMYQREDSRFDLFVGKIFKTVLSPNMKEDVEAIHEFKDVHTLRVKVFRKEHIVLLKAITERQNDFDDILTILKKSKQFDWQYLIDEAIWQYQHGDNWVVYDMEKTLLELKKYVFVRDNYLQQLYRTEKKKEAKAKKRGSTAAS